MHNINVTKRDGSFELLDINKIHKVLKWATEGLSDVSISDIEVNSSLQLTDKIKTSEIHDVLINTASKMISEEYPNYQYVATKLAVMKLRKEIYNDIAPSSLYSIIQKNISSNMYDKALLENYTESDILYFDSHIRHNRDYDIAYIGFNEFLGKYLVKHKKTKVYYETPQVAFMVISMVAFMSYEPEQRKKYVVDTYNALSKFDISLPTPIMAGLRTPMKQFSSCTVIDIGDSLDSITSGVDAIVQYASRRAGIGLNVGRIRAIGSSIRNGDATHTGIIPFIKLFEAGTHSCSQGAIRKSSATLHYPIWHLEFEDLIVLKNNKGTDENRVRSLDYCVQINKLFYERLQKKEKITLFSPSDVPGLYEAFFSDQDKFRELYCKYEKDKHIRKKVIDAEEIFNMILIERLQTGRIYIMNVDHANDMSSFKHTEHPIYSSNLCSEITLPTQPVNKDGVGEVSLCTLGGINLGNIKQYSDIEYSCELLVRILDSVLSYQDYALEASKRTAMLDRALGVGVINFAYYLAKNKLVYGSQESFDETHRVFEHLQYYLLKASNKLAVEYGQCDGFDRSKYADGILPIDKYKKDVDDITSVPLQCDWESLRIDIENHGLRNNTLTAIMPCESSAKVSASTNGVEAIRSYTIDKTSKSGSATFVAPELKKYKRYYTLAWDIEPQDYLKVMAVMQKFVDQSISTNIYYDARKFTDGNISMTKMRRDLLVAYKYGIKTLYYCNNFIDENLGESKATGCDSGACSL